VGIFRQGGVAYVQAELRQLVFLDIASWPKLLLMAILAVQLLSTRTGICWIQVPVATLYKPNKTWWKVLIHIFLYYKLKKLQRKFKRKYSYPYRIWSTEPYGICCLQLGALPQRRRAFRTLGSFQRQTFWVIYLSINKSNLINKIWYFCIPEISNRLANELFCKNLRNNFFFDLTGKRM